MTVSLVLAASRAAGAEDPRPSRRWFEAVELHGLVDTYFAVNLDQEQVAPSPLRTFDAANGFQLALAKLTARLAPEPAGFRLDVDFGRTAGLLGGRTADSASLADAAVEQAFATVELPGGIAVDFGRFASRAGAEVIEAKDDWLYSRSILFSHAVPLTHTGIRAAAPIPRARGLTLLASLVNGWDNPPRPVGSKKAAHAGLAYGASATAAALNVIYGYVDQSAADPRLLIDVVLARAFGDLALNLNGDLGREGGREYLGVSLMARYSFLGGRLRLSSRGEYFADRDGLALGIIDAEYYEGTVDLSASVGANVEVRLEVRHDRSNEDLFAGGQVGHQTTVAVAALAWF